MSFEDQYSGNLPHPKHFVELHSLARKSVFLFLVLCIIWSLIADQVISYWLLESPLPAGPNNENLAVFGPFDWIQIRLSLIMLLSMVTTLPVLSFMSYRFAKPGLFPREKYWLTAVLILTTILVPASILLIWIIGLPALFQFSTTIGAPQGVLVRYDAASIFSLGLGATWVLVVWSVTTLILSLTRIFGMVYSGKTRFRNRVLAISTGTIILTLPVEYDGLKVIIAIMTSFLAEKISRSAPVKMGLWDPHANID